MSRPEDIPITVSLPSLSTVDIASLRQRINNPQVLNGTRAIVATAVEIERLLDYVMVLERENNKYQKVGKLLTETWQKVQVQP
jgi:hypothetical protein